MGVAAIRRSTRGVAVTTFIVELHPTARMTTGGDLFCDVFLLQKGVTGYGSEGGSAFKHPPMALRSVY